MSTKKRFSDELREAIKASGMSRYAICKAAGVDQSTMSRFMAGTRGLQSSTIDQLAAFLDLHLVRGSGAAKQTGKRK